MFLIHLLIEQILLIAYVASSTVVTCSFKTGYFSAPLSEWGLYLWLHQVLQLSAVAKPDLSSLDTYMEEQIGEHFAKIKGLTSFFHCWCKVET